MDIGSCWRKEGKMKREIKFRAWYHHKNNNDNGWMEYLVLGIQDLYQNRFLLAENLPRMENFSHFVALNKFKHEKDFALMQFTGLKDKNEKEIYEGDIVRVYEEDFFELQMEQIEDLDAIGDIRFDDGAFWIYSKDLNNDREKWEGFMLSEIQDTEVIGNIYENPELLDNKKT